MALRAFAPGLALCTAIAGVAGVVSAGVVARTGNRSVDALVLAILLGVAVRAAFGLPPRCVPGVRFCAKTCLEIAVALLGASVSLAQLAEAGLPLLCVAVLTVALGLAAGYGLCRVLGLDHTLSLLVASGNAICGNSAIVAVAPTLRATPDDVAAAITFNAVLGIAVVLLLPVAMPALGLDTTRYGILAGLTIYAVPQVVAATAPFGLAAVQIATFVKMLRVLMLSPVIVTLAALSARSAGTCEPRGFVAAPLASLNRLVPLFIVAFLGLAALRSAGAITPPIVSGAGVASEALGLVAMGGLGLSVDVSRLVGVSARLMLAVLMAFGALFVIALGLMAGAGL